MAEIKLKKKIIYSGEVFAALMGRGWGCTELSNFLREFKSVDAVEVVRCKDCVNYCGFDHCKNGICDLDSVSKRAVYPNDFCSYGERRSNG